VPPRAPTQVL